MMGPKDKGTTPVPDVRKLAKLIAQTEKRIDDIRAELKKGEKADLESTKIPKARLKMVVDFIKYVDEHPGTKLPLLLDNRNYPEAITLNTEIMKRHHQLRYLTSESYRTELRNLDDEGLLKTEILEKADIVSVSLSLGLKGMKRQFILMGINSKWRIGSILWVPKKQKQARPLPPPPGAPKVEMKADEDMVNAASLTFSSI